MRIFKLDNFCDFAEKEKISDNSLKSVVKATEEGRIDADLGGGVIKQRLARLGGGKSRGYRLIICFKKGARAFFIYGFPKSERENVTAHELRYVKLMAKSLFKLTDEELGLELASGKFVEIKED
jgi:hypothetical protein